MCVCVCVCVCVNCLDPYEPGQLLLSNENGTVQSLNKLLLCFSIYISGVHRHCYKKGLRNEIHTFRGEFFFCGVAGYSVGPMGTGTGWLATVWDQ